MMGAELRLSDVLARGAGIEWFEAVSLVREVADRMLDSAGGRAVPELDQVLLNPGGTVSVTGAAKSPEPVRRLGQLLQACLVQTEPPVQLRLVVAQATAPEPAYASIREYSDALAYFERPDRASVLAALYDRAASTPAAAVVAAPSLDEIAPLTERTNPDQVAARRTVPKRAVVMGLAVATLVVAVTAYSQLGYSAPAATADVSSLAIKASDVVGTTLVKGISAVSETVGLGRLVPADGSGTPPPAPKAATPAAAAPGHRPATTTTKKTPPPPFRLYDLTPAPVHAGLPASVDGGELDIAVPAVPTVTVVVHAEPVYSAADAGVEPPVGVRPQLPTVLPDGIKRDQLSQIEVVVLPDGTVGSVKLLGARTDVIEAMLLSAAKAWTFKPAEKDGRPVAYRKTVWLVRE